MLLCLATADKKAFLLQKRFIKFAVGGKKSFRSLSLHIGKKSQILKILLVFKGLSLECYIPQILPKGFFTMIQSSNNYLILATLSYQKWRFGKFLTGVEGSGLVTYFCEPKRATSPNTYEALVSPIRSLNKRPAALSDGGLRRRTVQGAPPLQLMPASARWHSRQAQHTCCTRNKAVSFSLPPPAQRSGRFSVCWSCTDLSHVSQSDNPVARSQGP